MKEKSTSTFDIGRDTRISSMAFSQDGKVLAAGTMSGVVILWDVATSKERAKLQGHAGVVHSVRFSPDGGTLASAGQDAAVKVWHLEKE